MHRSNYIPFRARGGSFATDDGQNTSILGVLLAAREARRSFHLRIRRFVLMSATLSAVDGVGIQINLRRIGGLSSGTDGVVQFNDPNQATRLPQDLLTVKTGGTTSGEEVLGFRALNNDEVSLEGQGDYVFRCLWEAQDPEHDALIVHPGQGVDIFQVTSSTVGAWIPEIEGDLYHA